MRTPPALPTWRARARKGSIERDKDRSNRQGSNELMNCQRYKHLRPWYKQKTNNAQSEHDVPFSPVSFHYVEIARSPGIHVISEDKWLWKCAYPWADDQEDTILVSGNTRIIKTPDSVPFKKLWCRSRSLGCGRNGVNTCAGAKEFILLERCGNERILQHCSAGSRQCEILGLCRPCRWNWSEKYKA